MTEEQVIKEQVTDEQEIEDEKVEDEVVEDEEAEDEEAEDEEVEGQAEGTFLIKPSAPLAMKLAEVMTSRIPSPSREAFEKDTSHSGSKARRNKVKVLAGNLVKAKNTKKARKQKRNAKILAQASERPANRKPSPRPNRKKQLVMA